MSSSPLPQLTTLGEMLKYLRRRARLTQRELSIAVGYSEGQISRLEKNERKADVATLQALFVPALGIEDQPELIGQLLALAPEAQQAGRDRQEAAAPSSSDVAISLPPFLTEEPAPVSRQTIFVERARELAAMAATQERVRQGKGQLLFVIGGAGRGKTALVEEFAYHAQRENVALLVASGHCNAYSGIGDPYLPFRELLATLVHDVEDKRSSDVLSTGFVHRLREARAVTIPALIEHAPDLIGPFVQAKALQSYAAFASAGARWVEQLAQRSGGDQHTHLDENRLITQFTAALKAIAAQRPLLLILEDLHWIDAASSSLLFHLCREISDSPILLVGTYRPDEIAGHRAKQHPLFSIMPELKRQHGDIWLDLDQISSGEGRRFVDAYLDTQPNRLGESFRATFFRHTGGHALFCVELLREMQVRGEVYQDAEGTWLTGTSIDWQTLPAKVEGVIEKRIERLEEEDQSLLAIASVEGEVFTAEVVARVQQWQERAVVQRLSSELDRHQRLVTVEALNQIGRQRLSRYRFRHYLFPHYLYQRLHVTERAYLHEAVCSALESLYGEETAPVAMQLAYHYKQAGVPEKALTYLIQAGEQANRLSANEEAMRYYQEALALATDEESYHTIVVHRAKVLLEQFRGKEAVDDYQRLLNRVQQTGDRKQELEFLLGLAHAYYLVALDDQEADSALKSRELYTAAQALVREVGDLRHRISSLLSTTMLIHFWPEYRQQFEIQAQELLALSQELGDEELILESKLVLYVSSSALRIAEMGEELLAAFQSRRDLVRLNALYFYLMLSHYSLGNFERGAAYCDAGIELAGRIGVPSVQYPTLKAMSLLGLGRYGAAWEALQQEIADDAHPFGHAFKELGLGIYLFEVAAYIHAAAILEQVVVQAERLRRGWLRNWACLWFARALMRASRVGQREWEQAKEALATVDVKEVTGFEPLVVAPLALVTAAEIALTEGRQEDALSQATEAEVVATAIGYRPQLVTALEMKARVLLQELRAAEALSVTDRALQIATEMNYLPSVWRVSVTKAQTLEALGEVEAADQAWQAAAVIVSQMTATIHDPELQQGYRSDPLIASVVARVHHLNTHEGPG